VGRLVDPSVLGEGELSPSFEPGTPFPQEVDASLPVGSPPDPESGQAESEPAESGDVDERRVDAELGDAKGEPLPSFDDESVSAPELAAAPAPCPLPPTALAESQPLFEELPRGPSDPRRPTALDSLAPPAATGRLARDPLGEDSRPSGPNQGEQSRRLELERMASEPPPRRVGGVGRLDARASLSPNLVALFGALLGITTVAALIAIAMRLDRTERAASPAPTVAGARSPAPVPRAPDVQAPPPPKRVRAKVPGPYRVRDAAGDPTMRFVEGRVGFDPFLKAVEKSGVPIKEAYRLLVAFQNVRPLTNCSKNDKFAALVDRNSRRLKAFEYIVGPEEVFQAREGADGLLKATKLDLMVKHERIQGAFVVGPKGLASSLEEYGFEPALTKSLGETLSGHHSVAELEPGTRVRLVGQEVTSLGEFVRYAGLETLEVNFPGKQEAERFYFFGNPQYRGYFDQSGRAPFEGGWRVPVPGAPITSKFNLRRMHPVLHKIMPHTGVDFGAAMGVPVGASSFGIIKFMGNGGPCGNLVKIEHPGGIETGYCHLSRFADEFKVGDKVTRLQTIGYVGSTGRSTGPHLHFFAKRNGEFIDPETLNLDGLRVLPASERDAFQQLRTRYDGELDAIALPAPPPPTAAFPTDEAPAPSGVAEGEEKADSDEPGTGQASPVASPGGPAAPPAAAAPASPERKSSANSLYLTDEELLKSQGHDASGEVE
jgi:murein DD-endopeptidase MepM/ murein hydrolase activator NlpD